MDSKSQTKQLSYWQGKFGDDYIERNSDMNFFERRRAFFKGVLVKHKIGSVLEVGCNIGANLKLINEINPRVKITGLEPNKKAVKIAKQNLHSVRLIEKSIFAVDFKSKFDLVFTAGVLIHIADEDLVKALKKIYKASKKYILIVEYYNRKRETVQYRELDEALFKRPYDLEILNLFPKLKLIENGHLTANQGFDRSQYFLFEK